MTPEKRIRELGNYSQEARRNMMFCSRQKTKKALDWLYFYTQNIGNVIDDSERELSMVFDEQTLLKWSAIGEAIKKGIEFTNSKLITESTILKLQGDLHSAHISFEPIRLYRDKNYRDRMIHRLEKQLPGRRKEILEKLSNGEKISKKAVEDAFGKI